MSSFPTPKIKAFKKMFFDRDAVLDRISIARARALSKWGSYVRKDSRNSIKRVTGKNRYKRYSRPGRPPLAHYVGVNDADAGLKSILFAYSDATESVIVGPIGFNSKAQPTVPELMEVGGVAPPRGNRKKSARYAPRPFMKPAFDRSLTNPKLKDVWEHAITN